MEFDKVQDSGKRQEFKTGSVRDTAEGKGTPHLIAGEALAKVYAGMLCTKGRNFTLLESIRQLLWNYSEIVEEQDINMHLLYGAIDLSVEYLAKTEDGNSNTAFRRLAQHYENGAKKYAKNNWRKGQPVSRYYDSAMRHLNKEIDGIKDEDHAAALLWNLVGIVQTKIDVKKGILEKELDDFPCTWKEVYGE